MVRLEEVEDESFLESKPFADDDDADYSDTGAYPIQTLPNLLPNLTSPSNRLLPLLLPLDLRAYKQQQR